ncbi:MAG: hypothetical protein ACOZCO_14390 [Bacteroidota bacterium]
MDFSFFSPQEREQLLLQHGECLGMRYYGAHFVILYTLNGEYVEAFLNLFTNQVDYIKTIEDIAQLDPFLKDINLQRFW